MTRTKSALLVAGAIVVAFLVGFGWQFIRAHSLASRLDRAERDLAFQRMEATLGAATIEAQRGAYETSRRLASDFYTRLQASVDQAPEAGRPTLQQILRQRDAIITELSRNDAQAGMIMSALFVQYRTAVGEPLSGANGTEPATTPPASTTSTTGG